MINFLDFISRVFISGVFLFSGVNKIFNYEGAISWMEGYGIAGLLLTPVIILEIVFSILIIIGYKTKIAAFILALFSIATAFIFHSDFSNQMQLVAFLKNISLAGGLIFLTINGAKDWSLERKKKYVRL